MNRSLSSRIAFSLLVIVTAVAIPIAAIAQKDGDISSKRVTLNLENSEIRNALKVLFKTVGANFTLDESVTGTVNVSVTDAPFKTALESVLRSTQGSKPLTYRIEDGVFVVAPKVEPPKTPKEEDSEVEVPPKKSMEKITLKYAEPESIVMALGGYFLRSRFGGSIGAVIDGSGPLGFTLAGDYDYGTGFSGDMSGAKGFGGFGTYGSGFGGANRSDNGSGFPLFLGGYGGRR